MRTCQATIALALLGWVACLSVGQARAESLQDVDALTFKSIDLNGDGKISRREFMRFSDLSSLSMDVNNDELISVEELLAWGTGYSHLAQQTGKGAAVDEAKRQLFNSCDLNKDGKLHIDEFSVCALYDFYKADLDKDGALNRTEFTEEFRIIKMLRAALQ